MPRALLIRFWIVAVMLLSIAALSGFAIGLAWPNSSCDSAQYRMTG